MNEIQNIKPIKMPSINQFKQVQYDINKMLDKGIFKELPKIKFNYTIKIHGTNASIMIDKDNSIYAQKKDNIITPTKDNFGFALYVETNKEFFKEVLSNLKEILNTTELVVYGEWASEGVQRGVGVSELPKTFYAFGIKYKHPNGDYYSWVQNPKDLLKTIINKDINSRSVFEFKNDIIEIDFNNPKESINIINDVVQEVENECPVAKAQGVSGIGEGIVLVGYLDDNRFIFKAKGEKHSNTKVKKLKKVDIELENKKIEFANYATPSWRLEQMYQELISQKGKDEVNIKDTGTFIKMVIADIIKEELIELSERGFTEIKEVQGYISKICSKWFRDEIAKV